MIVWYNSSGLLAREVIVDSAVRIFLIARGVNPRPGGFASIRGSVIINPQSVRSPTKVREIHQVPLHKLVVVTVG
jgi:hypothetical protein